MEHPVHNSNTLTSAQAHSLLGTLSRQPADIRAAFHLRYQQTLEQLRQAGDEQRPALEQQLLSLSAAFSCLLSPHTPASTAEQTPAAAIRAQRPPADWSRAVIALLLFCLLLSSGVLISDLKQQIKNLTTGSLNLQQQISGLQQQQAEERRQWLAQLTQWQQYAAAQQQWAEQQVMQQHQQQQQLSAFSQQLLGMQQQLADNRVQLAISQRNGKQQQQQISRLSRFSDQLVSNLCELSAGTWPAVGDALKPAYLLRCEQSWRLAAQ